MAQEKEYTGTLTLGATTPTYDLESNPGDFKPVENISKEKIIEAAKKFTGEIMQVPPAHSAIKVEGKRVYELARRGKEVKLEPRKICIKKFDITKIESPLIYFRVVCSTGTYIRSLANDFGKELGCGAYLSSLCRTRIGSYKIEDAYTIEAFEQKIRNLMQQ
jgi:tRNA pseudouridine55 synthase